jgi:hypothetical protein
MFLKTKKDKPTNAVRQNNNSSHHNHNSSGNCCIGAVPTMEHNKVAKLAVAILCRKLNHLALSVFPSPSTESLLTTTKLNGINHFDTVLLVLPLRMIV